MPRRYLGQAACGAGFPCPAVRDRPADLSMGAKGPSLIVFLVGLPAREAGQEAELVVSQEAGGVARPRLSIRETEKPVQGVKLGKKRGAVSSPERQKCPLQWLFPGCS